MGWCRLGVIAVGAAAASIAIWGTFELRERSLKMYFLMTTHPCTSSPTFKCRVQSLAALSTFEKIFIESYDEAREGEDSVPTLAQIKVLVHADICGLYGRLFRHQDAIQCATDQIKAARSSPVHPNLYNYRGVALAALGDIKSAIDDFEAVVAACGGEVNVKRGPTECSERILADALNNKGAAF